MREIHVSAITDTVAELAVAACCRLPDVMYRAIEASVEREASPSGKDVLRQILLNADIAASESTPICQDTGLAVVFAEVGQDVHVVGGSFEEAVHAGVAKGYTEGYLRKSSVAEPLFERKNTGDNTPAVLHVRLVPGDRIRLKLAPKGAGSENKSALKMLVPADGIAGVKKFVVDTVRAAGSSPCPPMVVGVGIGGPQRRPPLCGSGRRAVRPAERSRDGTAGARRDGDRLQGERGVLRHAHREPSRGGEHQLPRSPARGSGAVGACPPYSCGTFQESAREPFPPGPGPLRGNTRWEALRESCSV